MNKTIIVLLFFIFPFIFYAQELSFELVNQKDLLNPGKVHSLVFKINNPYPYDIIVSPKVKLPQKWLLASAMSDITLTANESKIYLIQAFIPSYAVNGEHTVNITVINKTQNQTTTNNFTLTVNHIQKISVNSLYSSNYVKAGDTIKSTFVIKNDGNDTEEVTLEPSHGSIIKGSSIIYIPAGKSEEINLYQYTDPKQPRFSQNLIKLNAKTKNDSLQDVFAYNRTDVIPVFQVNEDIYLRFPVKLSASYIAHERNNDYQDTFQGEIYGKRSLDEQNTKQLEFRAIGPDKFGLTAFSQYEEYFINYASRNFFVHLGDKIYSSSYLTEFSRYGRGVELRKNIKKIEIGGFYNSPRFFKDIKDEINIYVKANLNLKNNIRYGYLLKRENNLINTHLQYLAGEATLLKKIELQGEYAISNNNNIHGNAWQLQVNTNLKKLNANASYIYAAPTFSGYFSNTRFFTSHINYSISPKFSVNANYQKDARNFKRDTLYSAAPYRERMQIGVSYRYVQKGTISLFTGIQEYEDRMEPKQFFYKEKFSRIELNQVIGSFGINLQTYFAETNNFLTNSIGKSSMYTANFHYNKKGTFINLYGSYSQLNRYETANQNMFLYGGQINKFISNKLNISASYQNTYYIEDYYADRNLFDLTLNYRITEKQEINVISRYALSQQQINNKDFGLSIKYILNLNVPIKKIKEYGSLHGNITNLGITYTPGIKLQLGQQTAMVDENGNFWFKNIKPDTYFLEINQQTLNFKDITNIHFPVKLNILEGENYFDFGIIGSASIKGEIVLENTTEKINNESIIIEISSGNEIYRKICDLSNPFNFTYLRPGNWQLKIYRNGLSNQYKILTDVFNFTLDASEERKIIVDIVKQQKEIKYLQEPMKIGYKPLKK